MQARRGELIDVLEGGRGLLAIAEGDPVGIVTWSLPAPADRAEVRAVGVATAHRAQGVGRALMDAAADALLRETLGGRMQARRGELIDVLEGGRGLLAIAEGDPVGIVTWSLPAPTGVAEVPGASAEVRALGVAATNRGQGVGRALMDAAADALRAAGVARAWLVTTNDNLAALALYQRAGWRLSAVRLGAIDEMRRSVKPSIPEIGQHGIPLRDELELELRL